MEENRIGKFDINGFLKRALGLLIYVAIVLALAFAVRTFLLQRVIVDGDSMNETLYDNDNLFVCPLAHYTGDIERFDIVVFKYAYDTDTYLIKRVIGLPGETVNIDRYGTIFINGQVLNEHYGLEKIADPGIAVNNITLGEDEYFVLGDNRNNSMDSRDPKIATVDLKRIKGIVFWRLTPFSNFGAVE